MKSSCYNITLADDFVHDELNQSDREKFVLHLDKCKECQNEVAHLRQLGLTLNAVYSLHLDGRFNYKILANLRKEERAEERKEIRIAAEDIVISLATLLAIVIFSLQMFDRPDVSPVEMVGSMTNIERSSVGQQPFSKDQVLELVMRSK
jgi:hypothetical protein